MDHRWVGRALDPQSQFRGEPASPAVYHRVGAGSGALWRADQRVRAV